MPSRLRKRCPAVTRSAARPSAVTGDHVGAVEREQPVRRADELDVVVVAAGARVAHHLRNRQLGDRFVERLLQAANERLTLGEASQVDVVGLAVGGDIDAIGPVLDRVEARGRRARRGRARRASSDRPRRACPTRRRPPSPASACRSLRRPARRARTCVIGNRQPARRRERGRRRSRDRDIRAP